MDVRLLDLAAMHPRLLWDEIRTATAAVLLERSGNQTCSCVVEVEGVPGFGTGSLPLAISAEGTDPDHVARLRRTYELSRIVELAAIGVAGLAIHCAGRHEIRDVAIRGTSADYLVDGENHVLEIAGRSRRSDLAAAWQQRRQRLAKRSGYYVCVIEFETPAGRLAFVE